MQRNLIVFAVLAITQVISWGDVGILPVLASSIARDLGLALPLNLTSALAPPALAALLTVLGPSAVLGLLAALSCAASLLIVQLGRLREPAAVAQAER